MTPKGLSRIQVQFPWQEHNNTKTPWIRVTTPYAGKGNGFHVLPEIGEEVLVDFEGGNAEKPVVIGTMFHGEGKSGHGGAGNHMKGFQTASGNKLQMNDKDGSVRLKDKGGASLKFDGAGNATTSAGASQTINVGGKKGTPQSLLKMDKEGNITLDGKTSITFRVGGKTIVISKEGIVGTVAEGDVSFDATEGTFKLNSKGAMDVTTDAELTITAGPSAVMSSGDTNIM
jgi:type VI secretion system secreted protein VgrG